MAESRIREPERWQLRHAAGSWWLLDMMQEPGSWRPPLSLNRAGAEIWECLQQGMKGEDAAGLLCGRYGLDRAEALADVRGFLEALEAQGVVIA